MTREKSGQPPQRQKPLVIGTVSKKASCGHDVLFELFPPKQDKFRDQRLLKLTSKPCPACREQAAQEHNRLAQEAAAERRKNKPPKAARGPTNRFEHDRGRLPDAALFQVVYSAATQTWSGWLDIDGTKFSGQASGVVKLLQLLDGKYREALALVGK